MIKALSYMTSIFFKYKKDKSAQFCITSNSTAIRKLKTRNNPSFVSIKPVNNRMSPFAVILLVIGFLLYLKKCKESFKDLPPGPFRFPILGNLPQLALTNPSNPGAAFITFDKLAKIYGPVMGVQIGFQNAVVLSSYEAMRDTLKREEWSGRFFNDWIAERSFHKDLGILFACNQDGWKEMRRFTLRTLRDFGFGKRESVQSIMEIELTDIFKKLKKAEINNNGIVHMNHFFNLTVLNILWSMIAGVRLNHDDPELLELMELTSALVKSGSYGNILFAYPGLRHVFPDWTGRTIQKKCNDAQELFFKKIIQQRRNLGQYKINPENFIDVFLREIDMHSSNPKSYYNDEQLIVLIEDLFMAGSETTSNTLSFAILFMVLYPEVQKRVQEEIDAVIGSNVFPAIEDMDKMPYTEATLLEIHRCGAVVPIPIPRMLLTDTVYQGFRIPKDTLVFPNHYSLFKDEKYWKDPDTFNPERFLDNGKCKHDEKMVIFGFGKRSCLGENLAKTSLFVYFTSILQGFNISQVANSPRPTAEPQIGFTLSPMPFDIHISSRKTVPTNTNKGNN